LPIRRCRFWEEDCSGRICGVPTIGFAALDHRKPFRHFYIGLGDKIDRGLICFPNIGIFRHKAQKPWMQACQFPDDKLYSQLRRDAFGKIGHHLILSNAVLIRTAVCSTTFLIRASSFIVISPSPSS